MSYADQPRPTQAHGRVCLCRRVGRGAPPRSARIVGRTHPLPEPRFQTSEYPPGTDTHRVYLDSKRTPNRIFGWDPSPKPSHCEMIAATCRRISEELGGTCPDLGRQPTSVSWSAMTLPERHGCSWSFSGRFRGVNADLPKGTCAHPPAPTRGLTARGSARETEWTRAPSGRQPALDSHTRRYGPERPDRG
jgi:hypothetical protein